MEFSEAQLNEQEVCDIEALRSLRGLLGRAAYAIEQNAQLRVDVEDWKRMYFECQNSSIKHNETMIGHVLEAALNGAFTGAKK